MDIGELIRTRRLELGLTLEEVGNAVGVGKSTVKKWEDGNISNMKRDKIATLAKILKLKPVALITGEISNASVVKDNIYNIPIYNSVSAGFGALAVDDIVGYTPLVIDCACEAKDTICINVKGDSMYPKIEDGDTIQVHKQDCIDSGDIGVVLVNGDDGLVKKVVYDANYIELQSINPMYPPQRYEMSDMNKIKVVGKVKTVIKHL